MVGKCRKCKAIRFVVEEDESKNGNFRIVCFKCGATVWQSKDSSKWNNFEWIDDESAWKKEIDLDPLKDVEIKP